MIQIFYKEKPIIISDKKSDLKNTLVIDLKLIKSVDILKILNKKKVSSIGIESMKPQKVITKFSKLFPENSSERSEKYYSQAHKALSLQNNEQRLAYIQSTLKRIKALLSKDQIDSIGPLIADIVEADGIVMTSEMDIVSLAEEALDIKIEIEE